jgi:hypothetical protein
MKKDLIDLIESDYLSEESPYTWDEGKEFLSSEDFKIARSLGLVSDRPAINWKDTLFDGVNGCFIVSSLCSFGLLTLGLLAPLNVPVKWGMPVVGAVGMVVALKEIEFKRGGARRAGY